MPGKASELLIWFGKSLRPVAMTATPASCAVSGIISGTGFAKAKTTGFSAIFSTISGVSNPGFDTPMKISASVMASSSEPLMSVFKYCFKAVFSAFKSSRASEIMPRLSTA